MGGWSEAPRGGDPRRHPPGSPGAAATPAAAEAIHGKGPARVQSRRRRRPPRVSGPPAPPGARWFLPLRNPRGVGPAAPAPAPRADPRPAPRREEGGRARAERTGGRPGRGRGRRRLVQPRRAPSPASRPSPTDPALRANPYPEVTDPACRLPLPTLFQHARGCSPWRPAADMGTARREIYTLSPGFSRASESSPDAAGTATLSKARAPLSGRTHSRAPCPSQRKENAPAGFSGIGRVTALDASRRPSPPLRIRGSEPDSLSIGRGQRRPSPVPSERHSPISQDRLTHVQLLFTWNPSPLRPSKFSFEYLLLPPRSAPAAAPPGPAP